MYSVVLKYKNKNKLIDKSEIINLKGFMMASKNKIFKINNSQIKDIKVYDKKLANPLVNKKVNKKFTKLINYLTDLLVDDNDDSGESLQEVLNQIEKFRLEIKVKYREYLNQLELEKMSKQLITLQKEAKKRILELQNKYLEILNNKNSTRSR